MNRTWSFYSLADGTLHPGQSSVPEGASIDGFAPPGYSPIEGHFDHLSQRIDLETGAVIDWQPHEPPADESHTWRWDEPARRWVAVPTDAAIAIDVRAERDQRLDACAWVATRAFTRNEPMPPAWAAYMQALRDVPLQAGFPTAIEWPVPPA